MDWTPVVGWEMKYEVHPSGIVRNRRTGRVLKPMRTGTTRPGAQRWKVRFSTYPRIDFDVAVLVLTAFVGPRPEGSVVLHLNADAGDNRLENLRWGTPKENAMMTAEQGRSGLQKLRVQDRETIIDMRRSGVAGKDVAALFGISMQRVCDIYKGRFAK